MQFRNSTFLLSFLHLIFHQHERSFSYPYHGVPFWISKYLPQQLTSFINTYTEILLKLFWGSSSTKPFRVWATYLLTFSFWLISCLTKPGWVEFLVCLVLPFYFINFVYSYVVLTTFFGRLFLLTCSGNTFHDLTPELREGMIETPRNFFESYVTVQKGLKFHCIYNFISNWEFFVTSNHFFIKSLQSVLALTFWNYRLFTSSFLFLCKNTILLVFESLHLLLKLYLATLSEQQSRFNRFSEDWLRFSPLLSYLKNWQIGQTWFLKTFRFSGWYYSDLIYSRLSCDYFFPNLIFNLALLLFGQLRHVQLIYINNSIFVLKQEIYNNTHVLIRQKTYVNVVVPKEFTLLVKESNLHNTPPFYYYDTTQYYTRTHRPLLSNSMLGFNILLSELPLYDFYSLGYPKAFKGAVGFNSPDDVWRFPGLRIFNLQFNPCLLNFFKIYLKKVLKILVSEFNSTDFFLVFNWSVESPQRIDWLNQDIDLFVDNIELVLYDKSHYTLRLPSVYESFRYLSKQTPLFHEPITGMSCISSTQLQYKLVTTQEFHIVFTKPEHLLRFINYRISYRNLTLIEDNYTNEVFNDHF